MRVDLLPFAKRKSKPPPPPAPQFVARLRDEVAEEHVVEQCLASISAERIRVSRRVGPPQSRRSPSQPDAETPASGSFTTRLPPPSPPPFVRPSSTMEVARPAEVRATPQPPAFVRTTEEPAPSQAKSSDTVAPVARDTKPSERMDLGRPRLAFALGSATIGALVGIVVMRLVVVSQQTEPGEAFELVAPPPLAAARPASEREHSVLRFTDEQAMVIPAAAMASQTASPSPARPPTVAPPAFAPPVSAPAARAKKDELEPVLLPDGTLALPGTAHDSRRP